MGAPSVPWVVTNPIYVNLAATHSSFEPPLGNVAASARIPTDEWDAEASPGSQSRLLHEPVESGGAALVWAFQVAAEQSASPYAAVRFPVAGRLEHARGLQLRARSDRPVRISAQLRVPGDGRRWIQSFYLDPEPRTVHLPFDGFKPVQPDAAAMPPLEQVDSLLFVADSVHTIPGTAGRVVLAELSLFR
jgi:hypothetical protein